MKSVAISGVKQVEINEVEEPKIKSPFVKIKITLVPLCTEWKDWVAGKKSHCLGHEAVGVVAETYQGSKVKVGQRVVVMPQHGCGVCELCLSGEHIHCENPPNALEHCHTKSGEATYAQFVIKEDFLLLPIPEDISDEHAAMCLCGLGPTFNASNQLSLSALDTILISGLGSVGLGAVVNASVRGARILAIESHPYRTQLGLALGVEKVISPLAPDALEQIKKLTFLRGVDKSVETSSTPSALAFLGLATKKKGAVACVGWAGEMPASTLVGRGLRVFGAWHWNHLRDGEAMWRTIRKSKIKLDQLITHRFPMSRVEEAWEVQSTGACGKIMMDPWN